MHWFDYLSYFFGGAFLANALPHLGNGISGRPFQSPFAKPPGEGLSSSTVNVVWGYVNLAAAYLLLCRVGSFDLHNWLHVSAAAQECLCCRSIWRAGSDASTVDCGVEGSIKTAVGGGVLREWEKS